MKYSLIIFFILTFQIITCAQAQTSSGQPVTTQNLGAKAAAETARMKSVLHLDTVQYQQAYAINYWAYQKFMEIREQTQSPPLRKARFDSLQTAKTAQLSGVFTAAQFQRYQQYMDSVKAATTSP